MVLDLGGRARHAIAHELYNAHRTVVFCVLCV